MRNDGQRMSQRQQGTALVIALVLLLAVTLLSVAAVNTSVMEMRMAGADEERMQIMQATDSAVSFVVTDFTSFVADLNDGEVRCIHAPGAGDCSNGNKITAGMFAADENLDVTLELIGSELQGIRIRDSGLFDPDTGERIGATDTSSRRFEYMIDARLDRSATGQGVAHLWRGYSRQVSTPTPTTSSDFVTCDESTASLGCS